MLAADPGGPAGGGGAAAPADPDWAPSDKAPEITGDSLEAKNENAKGIITTLFANLGKAWNAFKQLTADHKKLSDQFAELEKTAGDEKKAHGETKTALQTEKDAHKATTEKLGTASKNVERLESLCQLKGIDPNAVVPPAPGNTGATSNEKANEYLKLRDQENKGEVKAGTASKFYAKNKKEIDAARSE